MKILICVITVCLLSSSSQGLLLVFPVSPTEKKPEDPELEVVCMRFALAVSICVSFL